MTIVEKTRLFIDSSVFSQDWQAFTLYTENIKIILTFTFFRSRQCFLSTFRHLLQDARSMSDFCQKRRMWLWSLQSFKTNTDFVMCLRKWVQKLFEIPATCIFFGWNTYHVDWTFTGKSSLFLISIYVNQKSRPILALFLRGKNQNYT